MGFFKNELVAEQEEFDTYRARVEARKRREREIIGWFLSGLFLGVASGIAVGLVVILWLG
jgi:hypothetical protein